MFPQCIMGDADETYRDVYDNRNYVSRTPNLCCECGTEIPAGTKFWMFVGETWIEKPPPLDATGKMIGCSNSGVYRKNEDDEWVETNIHCTCKTCCRIIDSLFDDGHIFEGVREALWEEYGVDMHDVDDDAYWEDEIIKASRERSLTPGFILRWFADGNTFVELAECMNLYTEDLKKAIYGAAPKVDDPKLAVTWGNDDHR